MSWWGKVIGGTFGLFLGGPIGALLGASLGHKIDQSTYNPNRLSSRHRTETIQSAFFTATFSMMGYLSKSDGRVSEVEIRVAKDVMRQMNLDAEQRKVARRLFAEGKKVRFPADEVLLQLKAECQRRKNLLQMFLEILFFTALADGQLHREEEKILKHAALMLGFSAEQYKEIFDRIRAQHNFHGAEDNKQSLKDAYALLGVTKSVSDDEVKKAYRRQMNQHHPDKLVAKGLPEEMVALANEKAQDIRSAYEKIKESRKP